MGFPKSGRFGAVNGHSTVRDWSVNLTSDPKDFRASNTAGGTGRRRGALDWNGSFEAYGGRPLVMPGEVFTFLGSTGDENDGAVSYEGSAMVSQIALTWNWATQEIISYSVNFAANGPLTQGTDVVADATMPDAPEVRESAIKIGGVELPDVTTAVLTITADNKDYVNSSSLVGGKVWTRRRPGNIDWTLAVTQQNLNGLPALEVQDDVEVELMVDDTDSWLLVWGHVGETTGINVNVDTGDIIDRTVNLAMNGHKLGEAALGRIVLPGGGLFWGVAAP